VAFARRDDQAVMQVGDRAIVFVAQRLFDMVARGNDAVPINGSFIDHVLI
jgi:hypothetical protein